MPVLQSGLLPGTLALLSLWAAPALAQDAASAWPAKPVWVIINLQVTVFGGAGGNTYLAIRGTAGIVDLVGEGEE